MKSLLFPSTLLSLELNSYSFSSFFDHICNDSNANHPTSARNEHWKDKDHHRGRQHNCCRNNRRRTRQSCTRINNKSRTVSMIMMDFSQQVDPFHYHQDRSCSTPSLSSKDTAITEATTVSSTPTTSSSCSFSSESISGILKNKRSDNTCLNSHRNTDAIASPCHYFQPIPKSVRFTKDTKPAAPTTIYPAKRLVRKNKNQIHQQNKVDDEVALILAYLRQEGLLTQPVSLYATTKTPMIMLPPVH
jgi:hypothetical protein